MITRKSILVRQFTRQFTYQLMRGFSKNVTVQNKSISIFPPPIPWCLLNLPTYPPPSICSIYLLPPPSVLLIKTALKYHIQVLNYLFVCLSILLGDQRHFKTQCLTKRTQCYVRKISIMLCPNEKLLIRCLLVQRT